MDVSVEEIFRKTTHHPERKEPEKWQTLDTSAPQTFTITVAAVNDRPTVSEISDQEIDENTSTGPIPFEVGDVETADLIVTAASTDAELLPDGSIVLGGEGKDRTIEVTPAPGKSGTAEVTLTVDDGSNTDNATASETFLLTVTDANDPPSDTTPPTTEATLSEQPNDNGWHRRDVTVTLDAADEEGGSGVKETVYTVNGGDPRTVAGNSATVEVTTEGETGISYRATDNAGNVEDADPSTPEKEPRSLTIKLDKTAPEVVEVTPEPGAKRVPRKTTVTAVFSEEVSNVNADTFQLFRQQGRKSPQVSASVGPGADGPDSFVLDPDRDLRPGTYRVVVTGGPDGVADLAGNPLASDKVWTFKVSGGDNPKGDDGDDDNDDD